MKLLVVLAACAAIVLAQDEGTDAVDTVKTAGEDILSQITSNGGCGAGQDCQDAIDNGPSKWSCAFRECR